MEHLHECFTLLRSCASACKVTHLMRTIPPTQLSKFIDGFDSELKKAMVKVLGHDLTEREWLICQQPVKYGGFSLTSGKLVAGPQHVMSLQKCDKEMTAWAQDWSLKESAKQSSEAWLKGCLDLTLVWRLTLRIRTLFQRREEKLNLRYTACHWRNNANTRGT